MTTSMFPVCDYVLVSTSIFRHEKTRNKSLSRRMDTSIFVLMFDTWIYMDVYCVLCAYVLHFVELSKGIQPYIFFSSLSLSLSFYLCVDIYLYISFNICTFYVNLSIYVHPYMELSIKDVPPWLVGFLMSDSYLGVVGPRVAHGYRAGCSTALHHAPPCRTMLHHVPPCSTTIIAVD